MQLNSLTLCCGIVFQQMTLSSGKELKRRNIALRKPANQSSTYFEDYTLFGEAGRAVDGKANSYYKDKSCSHTDEKGTSIAWWEVDLLHCYTICEVRILNRNNNVERLHDVTVDVYEKRTYKREHCATHRGPAGPGWLNLSCASSVTGRYVRISKPKNNPLDVLTMCEVEIYGDLEKNEEVFRLMEIPTTLVSLRGRGKMELSNKNCCSICG